MYSSSSFLIRSDVPVDNICVRFCDRGAILHLVLTKPQMSIFRIYCRCIILSGTPLLAMYTFDTFENQVQGLFDNYLLPGGPNQLQLDAGDLDTVQRPA